MKSPSPFDFTEPITTLVEPRVTTEAEIDPLLAPEVDKTATRRQTALRR